VLLAKGQADEVIAEFREALKKDFPEACNAHHNLGLILANAGRLDEAITEFKEAIRLTKDFPQARAMLPQASSISRPVTTAQRSVPWR